MSVLTVDEKEGGVRLVTLSRGKVNAFDVQLMKALSEVIVDSGTDKTVRAVVITGAGNCFSAGLDFKAMMHATMKGPEGADEFGTAMRQTFIDVWSCPRPTVAAVNGAAIAAGFLVAVACDFRYASAGRGIHGLNELAFGAGFPPIAIELGRYAMGRHMNTAILDAEMFSSEEGVNKGAFHTCVPPNELVDAALAHAAKLGAYPQEAYAHVKAQLIAPYMERVDAETEKHKAKTASIFGTAESAAALTKYASRMMGGK